MIDQGLAAPDLKTAFAGHYPAYERMLASDDAAEGRRAFLEKRAPCWQGK
jgi:crotonobetainyl-CoA hydratase